MYLTIEAKKAVRFRAVFLVAMKKAQLYDS